MKKQSFFNQLDSKNKYILICCFFVFAVNGLYAMILGSLLPLISAEYRLNNTVSGMLLSAHQAGNLIAGFIAGILPVYLGRKKSVIFLCCFVVVGFLIMILTGNPVLLILGFLFTGLSRGSISNFNNAIVNEVSNSSPAALNLLHSIFAVGALAAPFLVILCRSIMGDAGWKLAAVIIIILALISIFLFSRMKIDRNTEKKNKGTVTYTFLRQKHFWVCAGILFFYLCAEATINGWIVKYFKDAGILSIGYAQVLASLLWAAILIGRLACVFIGDRIPKKIILLATGAGTALFYVLLLTTHNSAFITVCILGLGLCMAGVYPTTIANVGDVIKSYPMSMGVLLMLGGIGGIVMPVITGVLADRIGLFAGMAAIIIATLLMMVCILFNLFEKDEK